MSDHAMNPKNQKSLKFYSLGFILAIIITVVAFAIVQYHMMSNIALYVCLTILAILQLIVQMIFFVRLNATEERLWDLVSFIFTLIVIAIIICGSLWIMYNLNYYMVH